MSDERQTSFRYWILNGNITLNTLISILTFVATTMVFGIIAMGFVFLKYVPVSVVPQFQMFYDYWVNTLIGLLLFWLIMLVQCLYTIWNNFIKIYTPRKVVPKVIQTKKPLFKKPTLPVEKPKKGVLVSMVGKKKGQVPQVTELQSQPQPSEAPTKNKGGRPKGSKNKEKTM